MAYLMQFCGLSDPLQLFYLEQQSEAASERPSPAFAGFRPFTLDELLDWALQTGQRRRWDLEMLQRSVLDVWLERADLIRQWQLRLREEPADRMLVAGLGTQRDWERRCEDLLRV